MQPRDAFETIGAWIKAQRKHLALTQLDVSQRVGYALSTIRKIETGLLRPSRTIAETLAVCLEIPPEDKGRFVQLARTSRDTVPELPRSPSEPLQKTNALLPHLIPPIIDREREVAFVRHWLEDPHTRILSLVGPPGVGKTRLALHLAGVLTDHFHDSIQLVSLESLTDWRLVLPTIAQSVCQGNTLHDIQGAIGNSPYLLILDSVEQVLEAVPELVQLLATCPAVRFIITSRVVLHLAGEQQIPIVPLSYPPLKPLPAWNRLTAYSSVELFISCAQRAMPEFQLTPENADPIATICTRLEGLPLAIEIIALHIKDLSPAELLDQMNTLLQQEQHPVHTLLTRQQTLQAAIRWTYQMLTPDEQRLFRHLSVWSGRYTLEAIEAVCGTDANAALDVTETLSTLLDKSLLYYQEHPNHEPRFMMLSVLREFARAQLCQTDEYPELQTRYTAYYAALIREAHQGFRGPHERLWMERLEQDYDNIRATLEWMIQQGTPDVQHCMGQIWRFWMFRGSINEGRRWLDRALQIPADTQTHAQALNAAGILASLQSDHEQAIHYHEQSLALRRQLNDPPGIAASTLNLSVVSYYRADYPQAQAFAEEALALYIELQNERAVGSALTNLGMILQDQASFSLAQACYLQALGLQDEVGNQAGKANLLGLLGTIEQEQGHVQAAKDLFSAALEAQRISGGHPSIGTPLNGLAWVALKEDDPVTACRYWHEALETAMRVEQPHAIAISLEGFAQLAGYSGLAEQAARLWAAASTIRGTADLPVAPNVRELYRQSQRHAKAQISPSDWASAWQIGATMTLAESTAAAEALAETILSDLRPIDQSV